MKNIKQEVISVMDWEVYFIRQLYFYEEVCTKFDSDGLSEFLGTNSEMCYEDEFSKWLEDMNSVHHLKIWLKARYLEHLFDDIYIPTGRSEEEIEEAANNDYL